MKTTTNRPAPKTAAARTARNLQRAAGLEGALRPWIAAKDEASKVDATWGIIEWASTWGQPMPAL